ncbi:MAG TPA: hypothetical protein VGV92_05205 [Gammaproteobacteria bacterium]|nr:hypothetical protein [Gammaproteobacteria bacterium]
MQSDDEVVVPAEKVVDPTKKEKGGVENQAGQQPGSAEGSPKGMSRTEKEKTGIKKGDRKMVVTKAGDNNNNAFSVVNLADPNTDKKGTSEPEEEDTIFSVDTESHPLLEPVPVDPYPYLQHLPDHLLRYCMEQIRLSETPISERSTAEQVSFYFFIALKAVASIPVSLATLFYYNLTALKASIYLRQELDTPIPSWLQHWLFLVGGAKQNIEVNIIGTNYTIDAARTVVNRSVDAIGDPDENALMTDYTVSTPKRIAARLGKYAVNTYFATAAALVAGVLSYSEHVGTKAFAWWEKMFLWMNVIGSGMQLVVGLSQGFWEKLFPHPAHRQVILDYLRTQQKVWFNLCKDNPALAEERIAPVFALYERYQQEKEAGGNITVTAADLFRAIMTMHTGDIELDAKGRAVVKLMQQEGPSSARQCFIAGSVLLGIGGVMGYPFATAAGGLQLIAASPNNTTNTTSFIPLNSTQPEASAGQVAEEVSMWSLGFVSALVPFWLLSLGSAKKFGQYVRNPQETIDSVISLAPWALLGFGALVYSEMAFAALSIATNEMVNTQEAYRIMSFLAQQTVDELSSLPGRIVANAYGATGAISAFTTNWIFPYFAMLSLQTFFAEYVNCATNDNGRSQRFIKQSNALDKIIGILDELPPAHANAILKKWFTPRGDGSLDPLATQIAGLWMEHLTTEQKLQPGKEGIISEDIFRSEALRNGIKVMPEWEQRPKKAGCWGSFWNKLPSLSSIPNAISDCCRRRRPGYGEI